MKALQFEQYGTPQVLALGERPIPAPGPGEVLIKVLASGINPSDIKNAAGHFKATLEGLVPGFESPGLTPPPLKRWVLHDAIQGYEAVAAGGGGVKQVLMME